LPTETPTPTPTETLTPSPTFTPTLDFFIEVELSDGQGARIERTVTAGDYTIVILLFVLLVSVWGMWLLNFLREWRGAKE